MSETTGTHRQTVYPLVSYADPVKAIAWLERAFGFVPHQISKDDDGRIVHIEMRAGTDIFMISEAPPGGAGLYVAVDDPDAHHDRAAAAGAEITAGLADKPYGSRDYAARDLEGNDWYFGTYRP
ncbi:VOC family protein [Spirillospora sp. NPDC047279]|uniref:VOC family protein n=1 Tax=Spirillospora sp. NPDC047279 TaxID=3155478 RepID=UPI0033F2B824